MHEVERDAAVPNIDGYFATGAFDSTPREDTHTFPPGPCARDILVVSEL